MDTIILDNSEIETVIIRISEFKESSRKWADITDKPAVIAAGATIQEALEQIGLENVNAEITSLQEVTTILNEGVTDNANAIIDETNRATTAEATKVDKVAGKSLILDSEITRLSTVTNQDISNLVVKDGTKVLSDVNFSTAKDTKLSGIDTGAQVNAIDIITTTGTSGAATLVGKVLNIPQYSGGGGGGSTDWNDITNKPIVIGAGATQSDARAAIGAGTSNLTLGLTNTTAKAGDYTPIMSDVTGLNTALSNKVDKVAGKSLINDTEITRLTGIATGATANDTDANLKNRANHTGSQLAATISDFAAAAVSALATALGLKANLDSPAFSGTPSLPTGTTVVKQSAGNNTAAPASTSFVFDGLATKAPIREDIVSVTGNKTFALTDENKFQDVTANSSLTVPLDSAVAFPIGTEIEGAIRDTITGTFVATGGVTIINKSLIVSGLTAFTLKKVAADTWLLTTNASSGGSSLSGSVTVSFTASGTRSTTATVSGADIGDTVDFPKGMFRRYGTSTSQSYILSGVVTSLNTVTIYASFYIGASDTNVPVEANPITIYFNVRK